MWCPGLVRSMTALLAAVLVLAPLVVRADHDATHAVSSVPGRDGAHDHHGHDAGHEPGLSGTGAVYLTIANAGAADETLTGVTSGVAGMVEIHQSVDEAGVMRMRPLVDGLVIPGGGEVTLEPGGYHLMLIGLTRSLEPGAAFEVTLEFANGGQVVMPVNVVPRAPDSEADATVVSGDLSISGAWARPAPMLTTEAPPAATPQATPAP